VKKLSNLHLDYLAEIYHASIIETGGQVKSVSSAELAGRLLTSQSSVNRIIERLNDMKLIDYERYVGVTLNDIGVKTSRELLRKQAIIETFLMHTLQFEWHMIYDEARTMRHHVSEAVLQRMWDITGCPPQSPFGEWIDRQRQTDHNDTILIDADIKKSYRIARVLTRQSDRLQYLSALGLIPGVELNLLHKAPFDGPIQIQLDREYRILGHELATMITVIPPTEK